MPGGGLIATNLWRWDSLCPKRPPGRIAGKRTRTSAAVQGDPPLPGEKPMPSLTIYSAMRRRIKTAMMTVAAKVRAAIAA